MFDSTTTVQVNNGLIAKTQADSYFVREHVNNIGDLTCEFPVNKEQPVEVLQILIVGDYFIAEVVNKDAKKIDEVVADVFISAVEARKLNEQLIENVEGKFFERIKGYAEAGYLDTTLYKPMENVEIQAMVNYCLSDEGRTKLLSLGYKITDIDNEVTVSWEK